MTARAFSVHSTDWLKQTATFVKFKLFQDQRFQNHKNLEMCKDWFYMVTSLLKISRFTIISKSKCFLIHPRLWELGVYKKYTAVLKSGEHFEQPKMKDTCSVVYITTVHHSPIVFSWDPIIAGFMEKFLRFKTRKWRRQFVFFRRCHRWVSGATVVVMSETASINIIFAFSQRWSFHYFIWPTARVIVALLRRLHRSR